MNKITFPLDMGKQGPAVSDLQASLLVLLERSVIRQDDEGTRRELSAALYFDKLVLDPVGTS